MAEGIGVASGVLALVTFAFKSSTVLFKTVCSFKTQDANVRALKSELSDLTAVLQSLLETVTNYPEIKFDSLELPLLRCGKTCEEYHELIARCTKHSDGTRPSLRDWIGQQYLKGDIIDFKEMLAGYKSTINIALANANLTTTAITRNAIDEYKDMIDDTASDLQKHMQRLDERAPNADTVECDSAVWLALFEEKESTRKGLQICTEVSEYIKSLEFTTNESQQFSHQPTANKYIRSGLSSAKSSISLLESQLKNHGNKIDERMDALKVKTNLSEDDIIKLVQLQETSGWTGNDSDDLTSGASDSSWSNSGGSTHPSTLSSDPSVTRYQTAENRPPISFLRYKKPEADNESGKRDDDIRSIASISDDVSSLAESKYDKMVDIRHAAMTYFVSTLTGIPELLSLYERAAKVMSEAKFVRNHRRLLKHYYLGLRAEGEIPSQRFAIQFLRPRSNRTQISLQICHLVTPSEKTAREHVTALLKQEKANFIMLNRFLGERSYTARQSLSNHAGYASYVDNAGKHDENSGSDSDTGSELDDDLDERHGIQFEGNDVLSALETTKEFFINGQPFRVYQDRLHEFLNHARVATELKGNSFPNPSVRDLRGLEAAVRSQSIRNNRTSKKVTVSAWWLWFMTKCYPPPAGYSRISYICGCGDLSYVDVKELSTGGIERLQQRILSSASAAKEHTPDPTTSQVLPSPPNLPAPARMREAFSQTFETSRRQGRATSSLPGFQSTSLTAVDMDLNPPEKTQFLLICINTRHTTILEHIDVSHYCNDQHMFKKIGDVYRDTRIKNEWTFSLLVPMGLRTLIRSVSAWLPRLPSPLDRFNFLPTICNALSQAKFHRVASADFVRFQMVPIGSETFPGWFQKKQFPPADQVLAGKYLYEPVPMEDVDFLEIPLPHLLKPGDHLDKFWITTFPKKLSEPLVRKCGVDGQRVIGWGIRINEELNWRYSLSLILGVLIATGIGVVFYAAITSDKSSAFGMGAYLVAVFTTYITYQYFAWRDEL